MIRICENVKQIYFLTKLSIGSKNNQDDKKRDQLGCSSDDISQIIKKY